MQRRRYARVEQAGATDALGFENTVDAASGAVASGRAPLMRVEHRRGAALEFERDRVARKDRPARAREAAFDGRSKMSRPTRVRSRVRGLRPCMPRNQPCAWSLRANAPGHAAVRLDGSCEPLSCQEKSCLRRAQRTAIGFQSGALLVDRARASSMAFDAGCRRSSSRKWRARCPSFFVEVSVVLDRCPPGRCWSSTIGTTPYRMAIAQSALEG